MPKANQFKSNIWGLTGGIASGKTTARGYFEELGFFCLDADAISRRLMEQDEPLREKILTELGTLDRASLREKVFSDHNLRTRLESLMHPRITEESLNLFNLNARPGKPSIYEASLLVETGRYKNLLGLIVIDCPLAIRRQRLAKRNGFDETLIDRIIASQADDEERRKAATILIPNQGSLR